MRIGFDAEVLTEGRSAAAHYLSRLVEFLLPASPRMEIVLFSSDKICVDYEPSLHSDRVKRVVEPGPDGDKAGWAARVLPALLKEHRIDVFHTLDKRTGRYFRPPCPTVMTILEMTPWMLRGLWPLLNQRINAFLWSRTAERILTLSEFVKKDAAAFCGIPAENILVTPIGSDGIEPGTTPEEAERVLRKFRLDGRKYILSVSGLDRTRRNPDFLLEAFAQCHRHLQDDVTFVFTGNTQRSEANFIRLARKMDMLGIRDRVVTTGFVSDRVFQIIQANAAVSVITPFYIGVPISVLGAFSAGVPVVASNCGAIPEVAGEAAMLVDPYDPAAIALAVRRLVENEVEHDNYAAKGVAQARKFTWKQTAEATLKVYEECAPRTDR